MVSNRLASWLSANNVHYGWIVVGTTFLTLLATAGTAGFAGIMLEPLQREFGWQNADISFALAIRLALFGLMGPFAAVLMNRFGVRRIVLTALVIIAMTLIASLAMTEVWQLVLFWGIGVGIGTGLTAMVLGATIATAFTFLPSFLFILAGGPLVERTRDDVKLTAPLTAITAAVVGVIVNLAVFFAAHVFWAGGKVDALSIGIAAVAFAALTRFKQGVVLVIAASAAAGLAAWAIR